MTDMKSYSERGRKGGETTKQKYGQEYYQRIGKKGGKAKKDGKKQQVNK